MHPLILQQLATDRVNDMIATAAGSRRAREARRTRRARTSGRRTQPGLPGTQPEFQPAASPTRATAVEKAPVDTLAPVSRPHALTDGRARSSSAGRPQ
jgi:hypothetical protein